MSSRIKKLIISLVVFVLAGVIALVGVTVLTKVSTVTVSNLRFLDPATNSELFSKEVYLTGQGDDSFDVLVDYTASGSVDMSVFCTDPSVATVASSGENTYTVNYLKPGKVRIVVQPEGSDSISDSFELNVKENIPNTFNIVEDAENALILGKDHVQIFADQKEYAYAFISTRGTLAKDINIGSLYVVDDYNKDVLDSVSIRLTTISVTDPETGAVENVQAGQLVLKAKNSKAGFSQNITIQSRDGGPDGNVLETFVVKVDVLGNYICNIQMIVSESPDFKKTNLIFGEGIVKPGEVKINKINLTEDVDTIYARIRVVYTNGDIQMLQREEATAALTYDSNGDMTYVPNQYGNYYTITAKGGYCAVECAHVEVAEKVVFQFTYLDNPATYNNFINKELYKKITVEGTEDSHFEYIYWDTRFMRTDGFTDESGRIIGFLNGDPDCEEEIIPNPNAPEEEEEEHGNPPAQVASREKRRGSAA